jgi:hypothetical protein
MDTDIIAQLIPMTVIGLVIGILATIFLRSRSKDDIERSAELIHTQTCGGRFGFFNYSFPLVRLAVYDRFIVISYLQLLILFPEDLVSVEPAGMLFKTGLRINHNRPDLPQKIIIWPANRQAARTALEQLIDTRTPF